MSRFLAGALRAVTPYTPGEQPRGVETLIKLNTNENPYPPSPKVLEALNGRAAENLRLYSDPACADFLAALAETFGVGRDQVFAGNGSDEVLAFAFLAFCEKGVAFADITYGFYPVFAQLFGIAAQDPYTGRVESGGKYIPAHGIAQHGFQAFFQLSGGFIGKGNGQDIPGVHSLLFYQISNAVGQQRSSAASGTAEPAGRT